MVVARGAAAHVANDKKATASDKKAAASDSDGGKVKRKSSRPDGWKKMTRGQKVRYLLDNKPPGWRMYQPVAKFLYNDDICQVGVACLIGLNFLANMVQAQVDPKENKYPEVFRGCDGFFNVCFLIELILNMYGHWLAEFWTSGWNVFDTVVVLIGWIDFMNVPLGPLKLLRTMRAFRVFRLFRRIESLRKIMAALARSIPGVINAFLLQLIFMSIYSMIGVNRFHDMGRDFEMIDEKGNAYPYITARGQEYGFEYFGDFGKSLFTMFQVLTGESWCEAVLRPMFNTKHGSDWPGSTTGIGTAIFFVSFQILCGIIMMNVVVAVLLEKMVDPDDAAPESDDEDEVAGAGSTGDASTSEEIVTVCPPPTQKPKGPLWRRDMDVMKEEVLYLQQDFTEMLLHLEDLRHVFLAQAPDSVKDTLPSKLAEEQARANSARGSCFSAGFADSSSFAASDRSSRPSSAPIEDVKEEKAIGNAPQKNFEINPITQVETKYQEDAAHPVEIKDQEPTDVQAGDQPGAAPAQKKQVRGKSHVKKIVRPSKATAGANAEPAPITELPDFPLPAEHFKTPAFSSADL